MSSFLSNKQAIEDSEGQVKVYCIEHNKQDIGQDEITNIFKYVMPESLFIKRDGRIAIMCKYKFDVEHGIAVVFNDNHIDFVGSQDDIL